jgi:hypothetical protein
LPRATGDPYNLLGLVGSICNGTAAGLAVKPEVGKAIMFYTVSIRDFADCVWISTASEFRRVATHWQIAN